MGFHNFIPNHASGHGFPSHATAFVIFEHGLEFRSVNVLEPGAFVRTEERPVGVVLNALHEQVGGPHGVEQIACSHLFLSVVLLQIEELENVGVPRFKIHGDGTLALTATLVHVSSGVVEDTEHGDDAVGGTVGALDVRTL